MVKYRVLSFAAIIESIRAQGVYDRAYSPSLGHRNQFVHKLVSDELMSVPGIANRNCVTIQAYYLDDVVSTLGSWISTINGRGKG